MSWQLTGAGTIKAFELKKAAKFFYIIMDGPLKSMEINF